MKKRMFILTAFFSTAVALISCQPQEDPSNGSGDNPVDEDIVQAGLTQVGGFDGKLVPEISGLSFSRVFSDRSYVHNDSGDSAQFFYGDAKGDNLKAVKISGATHEDYEDMGLGPCEVGDCLFIGDIGDNDEARDSVKLIVIAEKENFGSSVTPLKTLTLTYGDQNAHNAEGLAVHPETGDVFIITKTDDAPQLFKLSGQDIEESSHGESLVLKEMGTIDLASLFSGGANLVTAMDISPDGQKFVFLTYEDAYEMNFDLAQVESISTSDLGKVTRVKYELKVLAQQEAIAYDPYDSQLYYTTESGGDDEAPLIKISVK